MAHGPDRRHAPRLWSGLAVVTTAVLVTRHLSTVATGVGPYDCAGAQRLATATAITLWAAVATTASIVAVVRRSPWWSVAGWSMLLVLASFDVVPWLAGDRSGECANSLAYWAALPIPMFAAARAAQGGHGTPERIAFVIGLVASTLGLALGLVLASVWGGPVSPGAFAVAAAFIAVRVWLAARARVAVPSPGG